MVDFAKISNVLKAYFDARDLHKKLLVDLRKIAVEECGFDQAMVVNASVADLLDGYIKGAIYATRLAGDE